jgi:hypothetical protein
MKSIAVLLLLSILPAAAQRPRILDLTSEEIVTWENPDTNAYFATDWTWNLSYGWVQPDSMARATQAVMQTHISDVGDAGVDFSALRVAAAAMGDNTDALFVRIRISPEPLSCGTVTNWIRVCNASTSALENLTFGIESGLGNRGDWTATASLLPAQSNSMFHAFSFSWPAIYHPWGGEVTAGRYFLAYTQAGQAHDLVTDGVMSIGPPRKDITLTVSNHSYSVRFDWLPMGMTTEY